MHGFGGHERSGQQNHPGPAGSTLVAQQGDRRAGGDGTIGAGLNRIGTKEGSHQQGSGANQGAQAAIGGANRQEKACEYATETENGSETICDLLVRQKGTENVLDEIKARRISILGNDQGVPNSFPTGLMGDDDGIHLVIPKRLCGSGEQIPNEGVDQQGPKAAKGQSFTGCFDWHARNMARNQSPLSFGAALAMLDKPNSGSGG